ncbi:uncharacterized protein LOC124173296 [Ischnura elegans]|uniref:uncharacterized protein LOC124173296 n=1 Tax=Ischnura elegans TaxID=197161 RepID=UPI001ED8A00A|nr:uncharacterized protein LOC124173296 [Ischnura elegans]
MSATTGNYSECLYRNSEGTPCRLCMKKNDYYYNIFTSIVARQITVEDALYDLVDLKVAVGDGLPATLCPLCLKKIIKFYDFRNMCHESDAELRKFSSRNNFRSFEERGAGDDNSGPSVETKGCIQDVIEKNSQPAYSARTTEIYLPVPDLVLPRDNELFQVKDEDEGNLSEGIYPMLYTSDPAGISTDVSDPLATDELSNAVTYKCPSVKEDHISDDEGGYRLNDCTDGASSKLIHQDISGQSDPVTFKCSSVKNDEISDDEEGYVFNDCSDGTSSKQLHQDSSDQSIGGEGAVHDNLRSSAETKSCVRDVIVSTSEKACSVQPNEIFIPVPDIQLPTANMLCHVQVENKESQREENNQMLHGTAPDGIESDAIDPMATGNLYHVKVENKESQREENNEMLHRTTPDGIEIDAIDPLAMDDMFHVKEENMDPLGEENGEVLRGTAPNGIESDAIDPLAMDDMTSMASGGKEVDDEGRGVVLTGLDWKLIEAKKEPSPEEGDAAKSFKKASNAIVKGWPDTRMASTQQEAV